jgi:GT2 family glycosyltransferase
MDSRNTVGLVTVTFNSASVIDDFLDSYLAAAARSVHDLRLYVVDNASADGTLARIAARRTDGVRVLALDENTGVARGNNKGAGAAMADGCDILVFINNDVTFDADMLDDLVAEVDAGRVIVPMIEATAPPGTVWFSEGLVHARRGYAVEHRGMGDPMPAVSRGRSARSTGYAPTCCMAVAVKTLLAVGPMDEDFFVYGDDVDFCLRLAAHGNEIQVREDLRLLHKASSLTGGTLGAFGCFHVTRGQVLLARKHADVLQRLWAYGYLLAYILARCLVRRDSLPMTRRRVAGFVSGLRAQLRAPAPRAWEDRLRHRAAA